MSLLLTGEEIQGKFKRSELTNDDLIRSVMQAQQQNLHIQKAVQQLAEDLSCYPNLDHHEVSYFTDSIYAMSKAQDPLLSVLSEELMYRLEKTGADTKQDP